MPPLYVYKCSRGDCGHVVEVLQRYDDPPPVCRPCDEVMPDETPYMTKTPTAGTFQLNGDGWARDNYGLRSAGS